jgi:hypothetical protein
MQVCVNIFNKFGNTNVGGDRWRTIWVLANLGFAMENHEGMRNIGMPLMSIVCHVMAINLGVGMPYR